MIDQVLDSDKFEAVVKYSIKTGILFVCLFVEIKQGAYFSYHFIKSIKSE